LLQQNKVVMKIITTLLFTLLIGLSAQAQQEVKTNLEKEVVTTLNKTEVKIEKENSVARLYMFKNYRVTRALSFRTKRSFSKLA